MALWPWIAFIAIKIRKNNLLSICILPPLFLIGSLIKYSFAIYSLCILLFLWSEKLINLNLKKEYSLFKKTRLIFSASISLGVIGVVYSIGRYLLTNQGGGTPNQESSLYIYSLKQILGYVPLSPLTSILGIKDSLVRLARLVLAETSYNPEDKLASILIFLSPFAIALYIYLATRRASILRFTGITALVHIIIYSTFHIVNYAISIDDRHYQQAGSLFLVSIISLLSTRRSLFHCLIITTVVFTTTRFCRAIHGIIKEHSPIHLGEYGIPFLLPKPLIAELTSIVSQSKEAIIVIPHPEVALQLEPIRPPSVCFLPTDDHGYSTQQPYRGRIPQITILIPKNKRQDLWELKSRFIDYSEDEWTTYTLEGWTIIQTGHPKKMN